MNYLRTLPKVKSFRGGYAGKLFRLCVQDYQQMLPTGQCQRNQACVKIPGILHTVNPAANDAYPIYQRYSWRFLHFWKPENFRTVLMMGKVEALWWERLRIRPLILARIRPSGKKKATLLSAGSTIVLITQKNTSKTRRGHHKRNPGEGNRETRVLMERKIGESF